MPHEGNCIDRLHGPTQPIVARAGWQDYPTAALLCACRQQPSQEAVCSAGIPLTSGVSCSRDSAFSTSADSGALVGCADTGCGCRTAGGACNAACCGCNDSGKDRRGVLVLLPSCSAACGGNVSVLCEEAWQGGFDTDGAGPAAASLAGCGDAVPAPASGRSSCLLCAAGAGRAAAELPSGRHLFGPCLAAAGGCVLSGQPSQAAGIGGSSGNLLAALAHSAPRFFLSGP